DAGLDVDQFRWLPDGRGLLYSAGWRGAEIVHRVMLDRRERQRDQRPQDAASADPRLVSEFDVGPDGSIAFVAGAPDNPCDLFLRRLDGSETRLTAINARLLEQRLIAPIEEITYRASDGQEVQGWVLR